MKMKDKNNLKVRVVYRDGTLSPVYERIYTLEEYSEMLKVDLLRLITDVEDAMYEANDNRRKDEWSDDTWRAFCKIKHKILDKAGDVGRIPQNIFVEEAEDEKKFSGLIEEEE